jgi:site-specific recombinase XerD
MTPLRERMLGDMQLRNFSPHTQKAYIAAVARFARHFGRSPDQLGPEHVREFLLHLVNEQRVSWSLYNIVLCALRFFYQITLGRQALLDGIPCPKEEKTLPVVLSRDEVGQFLAAAPRLKSKTMLTTAYAAGLRVSELVALRVEDIDSRRMLLRVRQAKGRKDRYVMLSPKLLALLRKYWKAARPKGFLFPSRTEKPLSSTLVHQSCQHTWRRSGLTKRVTIHTLRHSFATHLPTPTTLAATGIVPSVRAQPLRAGWTPSSINC